jgi:hypothetical protein
MFSTSFKKARAALAAAAIMSLLVVPGAFAHQGTVGSPAQVPPPPSSIAAPAGDQYGDLRAPDVTQPTVSEPSEPSGFDWVSAAIGAAAGGLALLLVMGTVGTRLPVGRRAESA